MPKDSKKDMFQRGVTTVSDEELASVAGGKGQYSTIGPLGEIRFTCELVAGDEKFAAHVFIGEGCPYYESRLDHSKEGSCWHYCKHLDVHKILRPR